MVKCANICPMSICESRKTEEIRLELNFKFFFFAIFSLYSFFYRWNRLSWWIMQDIRLDKSDFFLVFSILCTCKRNIKSTQKKVEKTNFFFENGKNGKKTKHRHHYRHHVLHAIDKFRSNKKTAEYNRNKRKRRKKH